MSRDRVGEIAEGQQPVQAVEDPVLNTPYEEPSKHWSYQEGRPYEVPGRRPASYWYKTKKTGSAQSELFAEEQRDDLPLVNRMRSDVRRWRESGYRGVSTITRDLLRHWSRPDLPRPLFYCQKEAAETAIYLLELAIPGQLYRTGFRKFEMSPEDVERLLRGERPGFDEIPPESESFPKLVDPPLDPDLLGLRRLGCKMATGSGKTVVMAMLIAWAFCNRGRNPATLSFPNGVLVCAPNLTVKERLHVLRPEHPSNYYDEFELVPTKYRELMGCGKVLITNWHTFSPKSEHREGGESYKVVDKGEETAEAFAKDRLGTLADRLPILVLNDEGHHCWRPRPGKTEKAIKEAEKGQTREEKEEVEEDAEEARVWLAGLDRINNSGLAGGPEKPAILAAIDLSATPFYLSHSGYPEGSPFPWLTSDFGLVDAIESGIVKVPRLPVRDDTRSKDDAGRPDPKYYRLWAHINDQLQPVDYTAKRPKPEAVFREAEGALITLAGQWKQRFDEIREKSAAENPIPPVLIVVCDNTAIAEVFYREISGERVKEVPLPNGTVEEKTVCSPNPSLPTELANLDGRRHTVRIDTRLLRKLETPEGQTKDEAAQELRELIDSVGKRGQPGENIRCVVSVSMLTEGWDANNVTHILGVRAFDSQLLCEQVVGRGLRRMNYVPDEDHGGRLPAEYVDVYGIPFSLIPFKGRSKDDTGLDPVYHHIFAVMERESLEIRIPDVESYTYSLEDHRIRCDVDALDELVVNQEPTEVYLSPTRGYRDDAATGSTEDFIRHDRRDYYERVRLQQIVFRLAQILVTDLVGGTSSGDGHKRLLAEHQLFPQIVNILERYIRTKVSFAPGVEPQELGLKKYANLMRERVRDGILAHLDASTGSDVILPVLNSFHPFYTTATVNDRTTRPVVPLTKSHINLAATHSGWEADAVDILEDLDCVECYAPNDRGLGLGIPYEYQESPHRYEPDFIVRLTGGQHVLLEIKGKKGELYDEDRVQAKNAAARKWVTAVNNSVSYGEWDFEICRELVRLRATLEEHADLPDEPRPFEIVEPGPDERYRTCIPLTSLRAAAGYWSEEQTNIDPAGWAKEWVRFETTTKFKEGMFVARVHGASMEPEIPDGSYCLFRQPRAGSREGKKLLVWHSGIDDPHTGGQYTLKVYSSEKRDDSDSGWQHTRIVLKPLNPGYEPIVLKPEDENDVRVLAEFVEVVT